MAFLAQTHANEVKANEMSASQAKLLVDALGDKLIDRLIAASSLHDEDLDATTLGKPGNLVGADQAGLPVHTSYLAPSFPDNEGYLLGLRGGAKKAQGKTKAAMKGSGKKKTKANAKTAFRAKSEVADQLQQAVLAAETAVAAASYAVDVAMQVTQSAGTTKKGARTQKTKVESKPKKR